MVYLIHFKVRYKHAGHYIGFVDGDRRKLNRRIKKHREGRGARLLQVLKENDIEWEVVHVWEDGDRNFERRLKNRGGACRICPVCRKLRKENRHVDRKAG